MDHDERLRVPLRWWVQGVLLVATLWLALVVATPPVVAFGTTGLALAGLVAFFLRYGGAPVQVGDGWFRAGRARIELRHLSSAAALDAESTRLLAGRDADARAYLLLRPYLPRAVRVDLADPDDPTPYWLVSTRRPEALAASLGDALGNRVRSRDPDRLED